MKHDFFIRICFVVVILLLLANFVVMLEKPSSADAQTKVAATDEYNCVSTVASLPLIDHAINDQAKAGYKFVGSIPTGWGSVLVFVRK